jgi:hypothetical protein
VFVRTAAISSEPSAWSTELPQPQGLSSDGLIRLLQLQLEEQSSLCRAAEARSKVRSIHVSIGHLANDQVDTPKTFCLALCGARVSTGAHAGGQGSHRAQ